MFADIAKGLKLVKTISPDVKTTPVAQWTVAGKSIPKVDGRDFVTGRHKYTSDMRRDGMLFGAAVRPPRLDAVFEGISCGFEKGGYIATCAEVSVDQRTGKVKPERIVESFECGAIVNPVHLHNQIEGAVVQAIGGALFESIEFANGKILNSRFKSYRVPRFSDVPPIEIVLVDRKDLPSAGAGETPIVGLAPAVSNAIFAATGKQLRSLPLVPKGLHS
jgi:CO/xanthine dehydrogenase Mo-binding subunit